LLRLSRSGMAKLFKKPTAYKQDVILKSFIGEMLSAIQRPKPAVYKSLLMVLWFL
jgi:hypothetical protein